MVPCSFLPPFSFSGILGITIDDRLLDCIETGTESHTGSYMAQLALDAVTRLEKKFGLIVAGLVTDYASNMSLMREKVQLVRPLLFTVFIVTSGFHR